jgi:hypothetical protein
MLICVVVWNLCSCKQKPVLKMRVVSPIYTALMCVGFRGFKRLLLDLTVMLVTQGWRL